MGGIRHWERREGRAMSGKINILHTVGRLTIGEMEGGVVKLVNLLDRERFAPASFHFAASMKPSGASWQQM